MKKFDQVKINDEACAWIAKLHGAEPTTQELKSFRQWMNQSPAHKAEIRHMAKLWNELNILTELAVTSESSANYSWQKITAVFPQVSRVAFSSVALLLIIILITIFNANTKKMMPVDYATLIGEQQLITLDDGSTMQLNTNSQARVEYNQNERNIYLSRGEAHFEVASNADRPFNVYAKNVLVRAIGTAFSVHLNDQKVDVAVVEGSVQLNAVSSPETHNQPSSRNTIVAKKIEMLAVLKAGQLATLNQQDRSIDLIETSDVSHISQKLSWREGLLRFSGDSLEDVIKEVSRYTPLSIVIEDPEIRDLRIGGFFKVGETEKMFDALESSFGIQVVHVNENLVRLKIK